MGMPLDEAFAKFGEARGTIGGILSADDAHNFVEHAVAESPIGALGELRKTMSDVERTVADELGADESTAVGQAKSMARDVITAIDALTDDIRLRDEGEVLGHIDDLERALTAGQDYDWRSNDHDPGGLSGLVAHTRETFAGEKIDPHFSGDPVTRAEAESRDLD